MQDWLYLHTGEARCAVLICTQYLDSVFSFEICNVGNCSARPRPATVSFLLRHRVPRSLLRRLQRLGNLSIRKCKFNLWRAISSRECLSNLASCLCLKRHIALRPASIAPQLICYSGFVTWPPRISEGMMPTP